jgi:hypothetical protein
MKRPERLKLSDKQIDLVIKREGKGLIMALYPDYVIKDYSSPPTNITWEDQTSRLMQEICAYQRFGELKCPFVPHLIDYSIEERWLSISRIHGRDLLKISQTSGGRLPIKSILEQLDEINVWLREKGFPDTGCTTKDVILCQSGRLYIVDFEANSQDGASIQKPDIYHSLIACVLERVLIRKGRTAKLTPQFILLAIALLSKRPLTTIRCSLRTIALRARGKVGSFTRTKHRAKINHR